MISNTKNVFISGISSGIGYELAKIYLQNQWKVFGIDIIDTDLKEVEFTKLDLRDLEAFKVYAKTLPHMDLWYNNAGVTALGSLESLNEDKIDSVIDINIKSLIVATKLALENMRKPSYGRIVNIASLNGLIPTPFNSIYAATKFAVVGFTRSLSEELKLSKSAIKISLVLPGFVDTAIMKGHDQIRFPKHFEWMVAKPNDIALEIFNAIENGKEEVICGLNAKLVQTINKLLPKLALKSTRLLLAKDWKEALGLKKISY